MVFSYLFNIPCTVEPRPHITRKKKYQAKKIKNLFMLEYVSSLHSKVYLLFLHTQKNIRVDDK